VPVCKKRNETDCSKYRSISLLPNMHKILSDILLSRLIPYVQEIIVDQKCGFRRNSLTIDHKICICPIIEERCEFNKSVHRDLYTLQESLLFS